MIKVKKSKKLIYQKQISH